MSLKSVVLAVVACCAGAAGATTVTFDAGSGTPACYTEASLTVCSTNPDPGRHLHLGDNDGNGSRDLGNHSNCCSTPYSFSIGGNPFSPVGFDFRYIAGTHTFTSSSGATVVLTSGGPTVTFPAAGWTGITSFTWDATGGGSLDGVMDNLVFSTTCGNGVLDPGEGCDDGNAVSCDGCSSECQTEPPLACGDGVVVTGCEACDDGNLVDGDGCDSNCTPTGCGNGIVTAGEQCDDGNTTACDGCSPTCQVGGICGDGILNTTCGEQCDDGNLVSGDGCDANCRPTGCGNGLVTAGEQCDDGNTRSCDGCSATCQTEPPSVCGDGVVVPGCEACDDGNQIGGDGCGSQCRIESCFACAGGPSVCTAITTCTNGDSCCPAGCTFGTDDDCSAGATLGPEFQVNSVTAYSISYVGFEGPDVAADAAGNFVVVWRDSKEGGGYYAYPRQRLLYRRFDDHADPRTGDLVVSRFTSDGYTYGRDIAVASAPDGRFVVVWGQDYVPAGEDTDAMARRFASNATPATHAFLANVGTVGYQENPRVAVNAAGNFVVVWNNLGYYSSSYDVVGRRFDGAGTGTTGGNDFQINTTTTGDEGDKGELAVASDAAGNFVVVWGGNYPDGVRGQRLDGAGAPLGGEFQVSPFTIGNFDEFPSVATDGSGNFVVAWQHGNDVVGRRFNSAGNPSGAEFQVSTNATPSSYMSGPAAAADPTGNFVVVWESRARGDSDVFVRFFDATGAAQGREFLVNSYVTGDQQFPVVAAIGSSQFVVAWTDYGSYPSRVAGRRIGVLLPQDLTLPGSRLLIRNSVPENKERNRGTWTVTDPGVVAGEHETVDDPRCNSDPAGTVKARLRFFSNSSGHDTGDIGLPCQNWTAIGLQGGYRYRDQELDDGPCKLVLVKRGRQVRALCVGSGATTDFPYDLVPGTDEGVVDVVLTIGQIRYCTAFDDSGGHNGSDGAVFQGRKAPPPAACPP